MNIYRTKINKLPGTQYAEIYRKAFGFYQQIKRKTKRRPYIRSAYFHKEKIFLGIFWQHFHQKNWRDRARRIKFYTCALELIQYSRFMPKLKTNPNNPSEIFYQFNGETPEHELFHVLIKENIRSGEKWFLSVFPE